MPRPDFSMIHLRLLAEQAEDRLEREDMLRTSALKVSATRDLFLRIWGTWPPERHDFK